MAESNSYTLRMRQLPKPEYKLMKALVNQYHFKDSSELFAAALALMYEVGLYRDGEGTQWIHNVITGVRELKEKDRVYSLREGQ